MSVTEQPQSAAASADTDEFTVSVVLPCLNEEESVGLVVEEILGAYERAGYHGEVIVVDNNSTDRSAEVAAAAGARVIEEKTPGYGAAIRAGIASAKGTVVVMGDADCTYPFDRLDELVDPVLAGDADMMIGSRLDGATRHSMPFLHRFLGTPVITWLVAHGSGASGLTDSQSGYRAFRRDTINSIGLRSTGMEFASEMLIRATQHELRVRETPLGYRERVGESKLNTWSDGFRHLRLILRLSPHIPLWLPGLAAIALAVTAYGVSFLDDGLSVGSLTWQPTFFAGIFLVLGLLATLTAALLGYHSPNASPKVRRRFSWISTTRFRRTAQFCGAGLLAFGIGLNGFLFLAWIGEDTPAKAAQMASLAQGAILAGAILIVFTVLYRVLTLPSAGFLGER